MHTLKTFGELKKANYLSKSIKDELRDNLIQKIKNKTTVFTGIFGYDDTVIPEIERAILSRHNINFLGLRGQAKTKIARQMTELLDEYIPIVEGSEINDDPFHPISFYAKEKIRELGDATPITWIHRSERYIEKLATPDVSIADIIGDIDPIKAANLKMAYSDERVMHFGIIPRSNRCIFVINEIPDLQARIQVALLNILQEGDIQIRGFKMRIPLDIQFIFTANPEDYTNRGSIITPLKDRIGSQILTHYPKELEHSIAITAQEARITASQKEMIHVTEKAARLIERIAMEARISEYVDYKSGVSARLTISAYESLVSTTERRMLLNGDQKTSTRISDVFGVVPAINGKIELVYEGEQEGAAAVANYLIGAAIKKEFLLLFPDPSKLRKKTEESPYKAITEWFASGNTSDLMLTDNDANYRKSLDEINGLEELIAKYTPSLSMEEKYNTKELILFALSELGLLGKNPLEKGYQFKENYLNRIMTE
jgi:magnesium chelatase subunit I